MNQNTRLMEMVADANLHSFLTDSLPDFLVAPEAVPEQHYVQRGTFGLSRLILALQGLETQLGDIPVKVLDRFEEIEPIEEIEFERDKEGKIIALRLR